MNKKQILELAFKQMSKYEKIDWTNIYLNLFTNSIVYGLDELAIQVYYKLIANSFYVQNKWTLEHLLSDDSETKYLSKYQLSEFTRDLIKLIPEKNTKQSPQKYWNQESDFRFTSKFEYRQGSEFSLCACCNDYVLSCEEIQNFPLVDDISYIRSCFDKSLKQEKLHKKKFLINQLLDGYLEKLNKNETCNLDLFFELWIQSEKNGASFAPSSLLPSMENEILKSKYFHYLVSVLEHRNKKHDSLIDDLISLLISKNQFEKAYYLNSKLSSPVARLYQATNSAVTEENHLEEIFIYYSKVIQSTSKELQNIKVCNE